MFHAAPCPQAVWVELNGLKCTLEDAPKGKQHIAASYLEILQTSTESDQWSGCDKTDVWAPFNAQRNSQIISLSTN